uniref:PHD finger protein 5A n=1 Tax=Cyanistes caeruleus TaxID=156563 RepID=A0A8C0U0P0_CYACU
MSIISFLFEDSNCRLLLMWHCGRSTHCCFSVGDGKCVICDSYVRPCTLVRICDECNYGSYQGRCVICGGPGVSDAYYCKECTIQEKDVSCHPSYAVAMLTFKGLGTAKIGAGQLALICDNSNLSFPVDRSPCLQSILSYCNSLHSKDLCLFCTFTVHFLHRLLVATSGCYPTIAPA